MDLYRLLWWLILVVSVVIFLVIAVTILRRTYKNFWYRKLDQERERARSEIRSILDAEIGVGAADSLKASPGSARWIAIEEVLLESIPLPGDPSRPDRERAVRDLFYQAGYVGYHEGRIRRGDAVRRADAADRLGRMRSHISIPRIIPLLASKDPEVVAVAFRALSRIGSREALLAILDDLPGMLSEGRITRKTAVTCLLSFGAESVPDIVERLGTPMPPPVACCLLEVLGHFPEPEVFPVALSHLTHPDAEVRSKAVRIAGMGKGIFRGDEPEQVLPLLEDPAWFVRLQAAKAVGNLELEAGIPLLGRRLTDEKWQIRNAAATGLTKFGTRSIGQFLRAIRDTDRYAKESICEEIGRTGFADILFEALASGDGERSGEARALLATMVELGFSAPLREYLESGPDGEARAALRLLLPEEVPA